MATPLNVCVNFHWNDLIIIYFHVAVCLGCLSFVTVDKQSCSESLSASNFFWAMGFKFLSCQPMWISSLSHATLSLCHLICISNMTSQSRISIDVSQWAALGIRVEWCSTVWDFPIFCRKFGIPVSSMRYQSCPSVTMTTQSPPAAWEARVVDLCTLPIGLSWFLRPWSESLTGESQQKRL